MYKWHIYTLNNGHWRVLYVLHFTVYVRTFKTFKVLFWKIDNFELWHSWIKGAMSLIIPFDKLLSSIITLYHACKIRPDVYKLCISRNVLLFQNLPRPIPDLQHAVPVARRGHVRPVRASVALRRGQQLGQMRQRDGGTRVRATGGIQVRRIWWATNKEENYFSVILFNAHL